MSSASPTAWLGRIRSTRHLGLAIQVSQLSINRPQGRLPRRRHASSSTTTTSASNDKRRTRLLIPTLGALLAVGLGTYALTADSPPARQLNRQSFTPYRVVSREQASSTSAVLTLQPETQSLPSLLTRLLLAASSKLGLRSSGSKHDDEDAIYAAAAASRGLWSVEVKQPMLQVARRYTPLPCSPIQPVVEEGQTSKERPRVGESEQQQKDEIRLLVRPVLPHGEVSRYLCSLAVGDTVFLRGPYPGFDVPARLGLDLDQDGSGRRSREGRDANPVQRKVVFLAGGTGIAPALQVASRVLPNPGVTVEILWANRRPDDARGLLTEDGGARNEKRTGSFSSWRLWRLWTSSPSTTGKSTAEAAENDVAASGVLVREMNAMKRMYGDRLRFRSFVDEEGTFITAADVRRAIGPSRETASETASFSSANELHCPLHSPTLLVGMTEDPVATAGSGPGHSTAGSVCECPATQVHDGRGRNLLLVSGPPGFVDAYAGPKRWHNGVEIQGPLGGVLGKLRRRDMALESDWLVLKL